MEHEIDSRKIKSALIPLNNFASEPDVWLHQKNNKSNDHDDIF